MLKIKDDIDLKELEKFGFMKASMYAKGMHEAYILNVTFGRIVVFIEDRGIFIEPVEDCIRFSDEICVIYDLIKADLVEKVGE